MVVGGVIYLHDISIIRFSGAARRNLEMFNHLCGDAALNKVIICTTQWGSVILEDGAQREDEIQRRHWGEMVAKGSQVRRFMGDQNSAWEIMSVFLQRASEHHQKLGNEIALQIQDEMAVERKVIPETKAGKELRLRLQEFLELQKVSLELEQKMTRGAVIDVNKLAETRKNMDELTAQICSLKVSLERRIARFLGLVVSRSTVISLPCHSCPQIVNGPTKTSTWIGVGFSVRVASVRRLSYETCLVLLSATDCVLNTNKLCLPATSPQG